MARSAKLLKFRLHLFEPPDLSRPDAGVVHDEPPAQQYQAAYELAFRNHLDMELFFASPEYAAAVREQARYVVQVKPLPRAQRLHLCVRGRMTLAGQRGSCMALYHKISAPPTSSGLTSTTWSSAGLPTAHRSPAMRSEDLLSIP